MNTKIDISFILPIFNEESTIEDTLNSIIFQKTSHTFEIIIADGMSTDNTRNIVTKKLDKFNCIKLINNEKKIVSVGFNLALSISRADIIVRVDGHSKIEENFIENCIKVFDRVNADCVGGPTKHLSSSYTGNIIRIAQTSDFGSGGVPFRKGISKGQYVDTVAFGAYKRSVFKKNGGYDEELIRNQDDELNSRLIQNNGKIWIDPTIKSSYYTRSSLSSFAKQYFQYGFYKVIVMQKRGSIASIRHLVPAIFVSNILVFLMLQYLNIQNSLIELVMIIYFVLNMAFSLKSTVKNNFFPISWISLFFTYFIMHFSYGLGTLIGFIHSLFKQRSNKTQDVHFNKKLFCKI